MLRYFLKIHGLSQLLLLYLLFFLQSEIILLHIFLGSILINQSIILLTIFDSFLDILISLLDLKASLHRLTTNMIGPIHLPIFFYLLLLLLQLLNLIFLILHLIIKIVNSLLLFLFHFQIVIFLLNLSLLLILYPMLFLLTFHLYMIIQFLFVSQLLLFNTLLSIILFLMKIFHMFPPLLIYLV